MTRPVHLSARDLGRLGGHALAAKLTPEQRSESARNAINARWAKWRAEQLAAGKTVKPPRKPKSARAR